jgi:hypothetical protein
MGNGRVGGVESTEGVGPHHPLELRGIRIGHRVAATGDAGVVDQDVYAAEVPRDLIHHGEHRIQLIDGGLIGDGPAAETLDIRDCCSGAFLVPAIVERDVHTVRCQAQGDAPADAPIATGHDGDFSFQH